MTYETLPGLARSGFNALVHVSLEAINRATLGTPYEGDLFVVGGAVRDELLGIPHDADFDLVTRQSAPELARYLFDSGVSAIAPVTYERFGTAMVQVEGVPIELVTARKESYSEYSRKPSVEPASYLEDALRRDFTVNTLMRGVHDGGLVDPLGKGLHDLSNRILRTPLDPVATFHDDPLRMLRAVRFRWKLGFDPVPGLYEAIRETRERLAIVSLERVRDEWVKMLSARTGPEALQDLMDIGLMELIVPEFLPMVDCEQGKYHHLDVWRHSLLVMQNAGSGDLTLTLGALFHDIGKPSTRFIDEHDNRRFFGHERVGEDMTREIMRRLKFPQRDIDAVAILVRNHMRLGSAPTFTPTAARRLLRDLGDQVDQLLQLVEADINGLRPGLRVMDMAPIRNMIAAVQQSTPVETLQSPLSGDEIMAVTGLPAGTEVGRIKRLLTDKVLDGELAPQDKEGAKRIVLESLIA